MQARTVTLKQVGWVLYGTVDVCFWGGGRGRLSQRETQIPLGSLTRDNLIRCINDGGFGVECIVDARVEVDVLYEGGYREYRGSLTVRRPDPRLIYRGIPLQDRTFRRGPRSGRRG